MLLWLRLEKKQRQATLAIVCLHLSLPRFISKDAREIGSSVSRLSLLPLIDEHHVARLDAANEGE